MAGVREMEARLRQAQSESCIVPPPHFSNAAGALDCTTQNDSVKAAVILPVYNTGKYIGECICSLLNQTHRNLVIFAVDDGSSDNSLDVLNDYAKRDQRVRVIHQANSGVSAARNTGLDAVEADGTFTHVWFFDSDDVMHPDFLAQMLELLRLHDADSAACGMFPFDRRGIRPEPVEEGRIEVVTGADAVFEQFFRPPRTKAEKRIASQHRGLSNRLFTQASIHGLRFDKRLHCTEDQDFYIRAVRTSVRKVVVTQTPYYFYRSRASSLTHTLNTTESDIGYFTKILTQFKQPVRDYLRAELVRAWWRTLLHAVSANDMNQFRAASPLIGRLLNFKVFWNASFSMQMKILLHALSKPLTIRYLQGRAEKKARNALERRASLFD